MLWIILIVFAVASFVVSRRLNSKFEKYSRVPLRESGAEVAARMLRENGVSGVSIRQVQGRLTDFYNPTDRSLNLSADVYGGRSVAAAAVAAHETGHALQHAQAYAGLKLRTALVPLQNISSTVLNVIFIASFALALLMPQLFPVRLALMVIIAAYAVITLFSFVTLGVEIDASKRAIGWLTSSGMVAGETRDGAIDALKWAAYTYAVAALSALVTLIYYILRFTRSND